MAHIEGLSIYNTTTKQQQEENQPEGGAMEQLEMNFEKIGYKPNTGRIAVKELSQVLYPGEEILAIIECVYAATIGVFAVSRKRVLYLGNNLYSRILFESINYDSIDTIEFVMGRLPFTGTIEIKTDNRLVKLKACIPEISQDIVHIVKAIKNRKFKV